MDEKLEKAKEILRQGELRIKGILNFSKELDDKIFKLLSVTIAVETGLLFFLLKNKSILTKQFFYTGSFAFSIFMLVIFLFLYAGRPMPYKGVGLPLSEFDDRDLFEILIASKNRYIKRFDDNSKLNEIKSKWLERATLILSLSPLFIGAFYFSFSLFLPIIDIFILIFFIIILFEN